MDECCPKHSGLDERIKALAEDIKEVKQDVKDVLTGLAENKGEKKGTGRLGMAFALSAGAVTPIAALIWALLRG